MICTSKWRCPSVRLAASRTAANASGSMSSSISTRSSLPSASSRRARNSPVSARSSSSERCSISGSKALTSGTIDSTSLSFRPSPACKSLLKRPMWTPSVPMAVVTALRADFRANPEARRLLSGCAESSAAYLGARAQAVSIPDVTTAVEESALQNLTKPRESKASRVSPTVVGCVVAVVVALWSTRGAWGGRPPHGEDVMAYLVRADFGLPQLVAHGRLDGWFPRFYLGYQEFLFNGPGVAWSMAAVRGVTLGALPVAMAFLARSLGLGRLAAGIAAVLSLLISSEFGPGLQGLYLIGLVSHQLGAPLFCLALGALLRVPRDARRRWVLLGAVSLAALAITHLISVMILVVVFPLLALGLRREHLGRAAIARLAVTGGLAAALSAWWLVFVL